MNKQLQLSNIWISHLQDEKLKREFRQRILENQDLFQRLKEMIEILQNENNQRRIGLGSYEKIAWSEYQADSNGYERALMQVLNYLKFT